MLLHTVTNALTAVILFVGGAASIIWSVNIRAYDAFAYDVNTTGVVDYVSPLAMLIEYTYTDRQNHRFTCNWLPTYPFTNSSSTSSLVVMYSSRRPECSLLEGVDGMQEVGSCAYSVGSPWFWPLVMTIGVTLMTTGGAMGFKVVHQYCHDHSQPRSASSIVS